MDVLDHLEFGVVVLSPEGDVTQRNPAAAALLGDWAPSRPADLSAGASWVERHQLQDRWIALRGRVAPDGRSVISVQEVSAHTVLEESTPNTLVVEELGKLASIGVWSVEMVDMKAWWSPVVRQIHEVDDDYVPNMAEAIRFYAPEVRPLIQAAVQDGIASGIPWDLELPFITARGRRIWVRAVGRAVLQGGQCVRLVGAFQDITKRKTAEIQLRRALAQARQYETLFENANALVAIASHDGHFVQVNESWRRLLGYPTESLIARPILSLIHPDDISATLQSFACLQTPPYETVTFQTRVQTAQETWVWLSWCCATDPVTGYIYAVVSDITEMQEVQEQLHRLAMIAQHTRSAVLITDTAGHIEWVNPAFTEMTGYLPEEVIGHRPGSILQGPETDPAVVEFMRQQIREGQGFKTEVINYRKGGSPYWLEIEVQPMRDAHGILVGFMGIETDIDERKRAEAALIEARNHAEALAAAAEHASRAKSRFLAMMSHELRTPMNGVLGMTQLLEQTTLDSMQRAYVDGIHSSSTSLLSILNDILDFSKIEAGYMELSPEPFALAPMLSEIHRLLRTSAAAQGLALRLSVDPALPAQLVGDSLRIRQVVLNLVGNAIKFTEQGAVDIRALASTGDTLRIEVEDTGVGISSEAQALLFQPFSQVDVSATRRFSGTGLGLAISRQLVGMMGGQIGVESILGEGSCFWLEIPLPAHATTVVPPKRPAVPEVSIEGLSILLVEDHRINQVVAQHMLTRLGCMTTLACDGIEALEILQEGRFDVILMDCHMPRLDGWETTRRFRAQETAEERTYTPIVALTANAMREDREACLEAGMDDYLSKPLQQTALRDMLASWARPGVRAGVAAG